MLKRDLVSMVHQQFPQHFKQDLEAVADVIFDTMTDALREKRRIEIRGLGSFSIHRQKGREFVNPRTGVRSTCPPNFRIVFRPGKDLANL